MMEAFGNCLPTSKAGKEFVNKILPNKLEELDKVIVKLENKINEQENINTQEIEVLEALQAQRILNAYKKKINKFK